MYLTFECDTRVTSVMFHMNKKWWKPYWWSLRILLASRCYIMLELIFVKSD